MADSVRRPDRPGRPVALRVAAIVLLFHLAWVGVLLGTGRRATDFLQLGRYWVTHSHASSVIGYDPAFNYPSTFGNDGQFVYYMALDPQQARHYMDWSAYRYGRVLYAVVADALALGQRGLLPWTLILVNIVAAAVGTAALAAWFTRKGASPWWALVYGLFPGIVIGIQYDFTEPLAYGLVAVSILLFDFGPRPRWAWAGLALGLAGLTRETTVLFGVGYAIALLSAGTEAVGQSSRNRLATAAGYLGVAAGPILAWKLYLWTWLGDIGTGPGLEPLPLLGFVRAPASRLMLGAEAVVVVVPALLVAGVVLIAVARTQRFPEVFNLVAASVLFVVFLNRTGYSSLTSSLRISTAVALAALLCLPLLQPMRGRLPVLVAAVGTCWALWYPLRLLHAAGL